MKFNGEYIDTLFDPDTGEDVCSANTTELQEWLRVHPTLMTYDVRTGDGQIIDAMNYLKFQNVHHRHPH
jgi:hypothetical protein